MPHLLLKYKGQVHLLALAWMLSAYPHASITLVFLDPVAAGQKRLSEPNMSMAQAHAVSGQPMEVTGLPPYIHSPDFVPPATLTHQKQAAHTSSCLRSGGPC